MLSNNNNIFEFIAKYFHINYRACNWDSFIYKFSMRGMKNMMEMYKWIYKIYKHFKGSLTEYEENFPCILNVKQIW